MQGLPLYHVTDLRAAVEAQWPGVTYSSSRSRGLNTNGDLVGEAHTNGSAQQAFIYTVEHGVVPLPMIPNWPSNLALDVSDRDANGDVLIAGGGVGSIYWDISIGAAAVWRFSTVTGLVLETRAIGIPPGFSDSLAVAVNNNGQVVGYAGHTGPTTPIKYDFQTGILETFVFPARPTDVNNNGQVCGESYRGDLFGSYQDLGAPPSNHSTRFTDINDLGWVSGRAGTTISDGAGHFLATIVRYADGQGWTVMPPTSHLTLAGAMNGNGDFSSAAGTVYLESSGTWHPLSSATLAPEFHEVNPSFIAGINDNLQVAAYWGHAILLTPLGVTIIPGDLNGDVQVDLDDLCLFLGSPIDLDGDGLVTASDEAWMYARLAEFEVFPADCDGSGTPDHCDIAFGQSPDCDLNGVPDSCQPDCNSDGIPDTCESDCNSNGVPDACDVIFGTSPDCNFNHVPDECDEGLSVSYSKTFNPPVFVPVNALIVDEVMAVELGLVSDVDFNLHIDYRIGYLSVALSHNGTTITLIDRPGHPADGSLGNGQLGYDIILDDEGTGAPIEEEGNFGSPFEPIVSPPSYTPNEALSAFDGMPIAGPWTITVTTHATFTSPVDEFFGWGLLIAPVAVSVPPCICQAMVSSYCSSTPNSTGFAASISSNFECSVADNELELVASSVPNGTGLFFYGTGQTSLPFGNGVRCVDGGTLGLFRLPAQTAVNNTLKHTLDLMSPPQASGAITPGSSWNFQAWFRDVNAGGAMFDTSDGLQMTFIP